MNIRKPVKIQQNDKILVKYAPQAQIFVVVSRVSGPNITQNW